jgi:hypothetical protein
MSLAVSSVSAGSRRRRELLLANDFQYPRGCDGKIKSCTFTAEWRNASNTAVNFTLTAKLDVNQWVGITWIREVSLVGANVYTLSVIKSPLENKPTVLLTKGIMDDKGLIHVASRQDSASDAIVEYNEAQKLAVAHFSRNIRAAKSTEGEEADLSMCPIWVFLPEAGNVILPEQSILLTTVAPGQNVTKDQSTMAPKTIKGQKDSQAASNKKAKFTMRSPEGSLFYMTNPKCL